MHEHSETGEFSAVAKTKLMKHRRTVPVPMYVSILTLMLWYCLGVAPIQAQSGPWSNPIAQAPISWMPKLTTDTMGNVHMVWTENFAADYYYGKVWYSMWNGSEWSTPVDISVDPQIGLSGWPSIAVDAGGVIHVVFGVQGKDLYYTQARVDGEPWRASSWSFPMPFHAGDGLYSRYSDIVVDEGGTVHVVSEAARRLEDGGLQGQIYYRSSPDRGLTWSRIVPLSSTPYWSAWPHLAVRDREVHIVWVDVEITGSWEEAGFGGGWGHKGYYMRSDDQGRSWSEPVILRAEAPITPMDVLVDSEGTIHVSSGGEALWNGARRGGSFHQWSTDRGRTWSSPEPIFQLSDGAIAGSTGIHQGWANMALDGDGRLHAIAGNGQVLYHAWWEGGEWNRPETITEEGSASQAYLAIGGGNQLHIVWTHDTSGWDWADTYVMYSTREFPALPIAPQPWPTPDPARIPSRPMPRPTSRPTVTASRISGEATPAETVTAVVLPTATPTPVVWEREDQDNYPAQAGPAMPLLVGTVPVVFLVTVVVVIARRRSK